MSRNEHLKRFSGMGFVYFVYSPTFRLMKIGQTKKPFMSGRWMHYVTESPERLTPVLVLATRIGLEPRIHKAAERFLSHGEWFMWPSALEAVRQAIEVVKAEGWQVEVAQVLHAPLADQIVR